MTAHITAYGCLVADPELRETRTGKPWATARLAVALPRPRGADDDAEAPTLWLGVTVFGERGADNLPRHRKGDSLSAAGRPELRAWTDRERARREGWTVIADSVIGPRAGPSHGLRGQATAEPVVHFYSAALGHNPAAVDSSVLHGETPLGDYVGKCRSALTQGAASAGGCSALSRAG